MKTHTLLYVVETRTDDNEIMDSCLFIGSSVELCERFIRNNLDFYGDDFTIKYYWCVTEMNVDFDQFNDETKKETKTHGLTSHYYNKEGIVITEL